MAGLSSAAVGVSKSIQQMLMERKLAEQQAIENTQKQQQIGLQGRQIDEQAAYRRATEAETVRQHQASEADKADTQKMRRVNLMALQPVGTVMNEQAGQEALDAGMPAGMLDYQPATSGASTLQGEEAGHPTQYRFQGKEADRLKQEGITAANQRAQESRDAAAQNNEANRQTRIMLAGLTRQNADNGLMKVEHKGPDGRTVIEYLPKSEIRGKTYEKGVSSATDSRLASAEAVNQTGEDIIAKLSDPQIAGVVGPAMGRYNTLRDFIGNPPPEYADLAGQIESYAIANMGVHGMRSAQGAEHIKALLDKHHDPASLIATIQGLNSFSQHFMENEGRKPKTGTTTKTATKPTAEDLLKKYGGAGGR